MEPIRLFIFDCDGVVIDSRDFQDTLYNRMREKVGLPPMTRRESDTAFALTTEDAFDFLIPPRLREPAKQALEAIDTAPLLPLIQPVPGVVDLLQSLRDAGRHVAMNTNSGDYIHPILKDLGLHPYFEMIVTADDVALPKPDPEGVKAILARFALSAKDAVYIGDTNLDEETARAAGVTFWAFRDPHLTADRHFREFVEIAAELGAAKP